MRDCSFRPSTLALVALLAATPVATSARAQADEREDLRLSVVDAPGPLKPGSVTLLTVRAPEDLAALDGDLAGRRVRFWNAASPKQWHALLGIGLDAEPGQQMLLIRGRSIEGAVAETRVPVLIERHSFETRRIRVDPKLANPPEEQVARILREAKAMADAFGVVTPERLWQGRFSPPVPGTATSSFGRLTVTNGKRSGQHQGTDFRAATGTPVRAPNDGRVVLAENLYFAGNTVIIDHGLGVFSLLAHLSRIDVEAGEMVARGDILGGSGATGRVTGPHLHWAVRFGEMSVDPLALMTAVATLPDDAPRATR